MKIHLNTGIFTLTSYAKTHRIAWRQRVKGHLEPAGGIKRFFDVAEDVNLRDVAILDFLPLDWIIKQVEVIFVEDTGKGEICPSVHDILLIVG